MIENSCFFFDLNPKNSNKQYFRQKTQKKIDII